MRLRISIPVFVVATVLFPVSQGYAQDTDTSQTELDFLFSEPENETQEPESPPQSIPASEQAKETVGVQNDSAEKVDVESAEAEPRAPRKSGSRLIEEIIVTAQKREEGIQDVPISVSAFSGEVLDAKGITTTQDLPMLTPGLNVGSQVGYTTLYLRGVGSDAFVMADPSVALYLDNVYIPSAQSMGDAFGAVDRIEVLKGPQGTLFGRNAVGGAINVITQSPDFQSTSTEIQSSIESRNTIKTRVHTNIPITDGLAFNLTGLYNEGDYHQGGTGAGMPFPKEVQRGARAKIRWSPAEFAELDFTGYRMRSQGVGTFLQLNAYPSLLGRAVGIQPQTGYDGEVDGPAHFGNTNTILTGRMSLFFEGFDTRLFVSDQYQSVNGLLDFDGSPQPLVFFGTPALFSDVQTAEFQILSNEGSWGSDWLEWILGAYYFKSTQGYDRIDLWISRIDLDGGTGGGISLPEPLVNILNLTLDPLGLSLPTGQLILNALIDTDSWAGFAQTTMDFTDWFALTLGLRYQVEERVIGASSAGIGYADGSVTNLFDWDHGTDADGNRVPPTDETISLKPKVSLNFRPWQDNSLVFLSYQEALKSSTYNVVTIYTAPNYVKPEETAAWELGIKTDFLDGLVNFNAAVFYYDIKNLQAQFISVLQGGVVSFENAGKARIQGADFEFVAQLLPNVFDDLVLTGGAAYLDAIYTEYPDGTGFNETTGIVSGGNDYSGNRIVRSPEWSGSLTLSKTWSAPGGSFELAGDAYYTDEYFYASNNSVQSRQESYTLLSARMSYFYEPWSLRLTAFGKNINDVKYTTGQFPADFGTPQSLAPPATYGFRLNWMF